MDTIFRSWLPQSTSRFFKKAQTKKPKKEKVEITGGHLSGKKIAEQLEPF